MERDAKPSSKIIVPVEIPQLTPEEQAEREKALASILKLRAQLPPLEAPAGELVRRAREPTGR